MGNPRLYTGPSSWRLSLLVMLAAYFACHVQIGVANGQTLETKCPFGHEGDNCSVAIDYCEKLTPCSNEASCDPMPFEPGYICLCAEGYTGDRCEIDVNECTLRPCLNGGRCTDGKNNFTCDCNGTGYQGRLCEIDIDECIHNNPCVNGRCENTPGSYHCECEKEQDCGQNCDRKDPCKMTEPVCHNGASCTAYCDEIDQLTHRPNFKCVCLEGFEGRNCSIVNKIVRDHDNAANNLCTDNLFLLIGLLSIIQTVAIH